MSLNSQKILGINITVSPREKVLEEVRKYLVRQKKYQEQGNGKDFKPLVIVTPNPEQIVLAQHNPMYADILNQADLALPDGIGVSLAIKLLASRRQTRTSSPKVQRVPGVEFMEDLVRLAANQSITIGLIGGRGDLAVRALECLRTEHPELTGWADAGPELVVGKQGILEGPGEAYWSSLAQKIQASNTGILFVGLGAPKQEYFIMRLIHEYRRSHTTCRIVLMSVGGSFDIFAGSLKRAPVIIRSIGFEWFWRLIVQPWRWRRQLALLKFVYLVLKEKMRLY